MAFAPAAVIDGPDRQPLPYGLFSVVPLAEAATERWENNVKWLAICSDPLNIVVGDCDAPTGFPKQFPENMVTGSANAFTVYGTAKCGLDENTPQAVQDAAESVLLNHEEAAAERRLWQTFDDAATVSAGSTNPVLALARLEQFIADEYGSKGVIHMSRRAASVYASYKYIEANGTQMQTNLGTPVAVGTGYPGTGVAGAAPAANEQFIAATPALFGYRSQVILPFNNPGDLMARGTNDMFGIAERNYLIGYDPCGVAMASVLLG